MMTLLSRFLLPLALCSVLGSPALRAEEATAASVTTTSQSDVLPQRNPDYACTQCHKKESEGMHGKHAKATNPNNLGPVTCTNCHGKPSPRHREGVKDVMNFADASMPLDQKNGVCLSCHEPKPLREAFWAHDVHATKLACTSCHELHIAKEPMVGISDKARIGLCVDCHGKQHAAKLANEAEASDEEAP